MLAQSDIAIYVPISRLLDDRSDAARSAFFRCDSTEVIRGDILSAAPIPSLRDHLAAELTRTRARSAALTDCVDEAELVGQHSRLMSPLVWDLAHIGNQEELWLVRDVGGREPVRADIDQLYDAFQHPRADRPALPLLDPGEARDYAGTVRAKVWDVLADSDLRGDRPTSDGFVFGMIAQHEQQHDETMLATHQLRTGPAVLSAAPAPAAALPVSGEIIVPAGEFTMGTSTDPWALDNERPAHPVRCPVRD